MEALDGLLTAAQGLVSTGGLFANAAVTLVGGFMLLMKMRGIGREDQIGDEQVRSVKQSGDLVDRVLQALDRSNAREAALAGRVDQLTIENKTLLGELTDVRVEVGLMRNQLRNLTALLRQVRDGTVSPAAIEIPEQ